MTSFHPGGLRLTLDAVRAAGLSYGDSVLDIGFGSAASLAVLTDELHIISYGIDRSERAVAEASARYPSFRLYKSEADSLPFADSSFDCVMLECILTLVSSPGSVLLEAFRVLRPGGHLIISSLTYTGELTSAQPYSDTATDLFTDGLIIPDVLEQYLLSRGMCKILIEDRSYDLAQYVVDSIMEYGSLEERIRTESSQSGLSIFDCDKTYPPKTTGYHLFVFRKPAQSETVSSDHQDTLFGSPVDVLAASRMNTPLTKLDQAAVDAFQLEAFKRTMKYAQKHSVFYSELFEGFDPRSIKTINDICTLPATSESDLAGKEWMFLCIPATDVDRIVTVPVNDPGKAGSSGAAVTDSSVSTGSVMSLSTTGTGGKRKRIAYTSEDQERSIEFINRGFLTMGCYEGEKMLIFMSGSSEGSIGDLVIRAMKPLNMDIRVYGAVTDIESAYHEIMSFRPGVVEALPWHAAALARYGAKYGNPEREFIRSVNLSADVVPDSIVTRLEQLWGCTVHRHYGSTEMAIFGGVECIHHRGYHTRPCDILYEIPEPDEKGYGELLITTLDRQAMPLIRYRTGDIGKITDEPCQCGCRLRRIEKLLGRSNSLISLNSGSFYLSELADVLYSIPEVIDFDVALMGTTDKDLTPASLKSISAIDLVVRALTGESVDASLVRNRLMTLPGVCEGTADGSLCLCLNFEQTDSFPDGYNLKKKISIRPKHL